MAHATQAHGGALYEEKDSTAEAIAAQQAGNRVAALEAALGVAIRKDEAALADLKAAEHQAVVAAADEANGAFKHSVMELDGLLFGELKPLVDKVAKARLAVKDRSESDTGVSSALIDFDAWFKVDLHRNCSALIPEGRTYVKNIDEEKRPLSSWVDNVTYAMSRRHKGR